MCIRQLPLLQFDLDRVTMKLEIAQLRVETSDVCARAQLAVALQVRGDVIVEGAQHLQLG